MRGENLNDQLDPLVLIFLALIFAGAGLAFFAALATGSESVAETHSLLGFSIGVTSATLWLAEVNPPWLYFGITFGSAAGLVAPSHWVLGVSGLLCLGLARGLQVRFQL